METCDLRGEKERDGTAIRKEDDDPSVLRCHHHLGIHGKPQISLVVPLAQVRKGSSLVAALSHTGMQVHDGNLSRL